MELDEFPPRRDQQRDYLWRAQTYLWADEVPERKIDREDRAYIMVVCIVMSSLGARAIEIAQAVDRKIGPRPPE